MIRKEEGSSATDSLSEDVTDVTGVRKKEEGRCNSTADSNPNFKCQSVTLACRKYRFKTLYALDQLLPFYGFYQRICI